MRATQFRDPKLLRPFSVKIASIEEKYLHVVAINEARAALEAKKEWRRNNKPKVVDVRREEAA